MNVFLNDLPQFSHKIWAGGSDHGVKCFGLWYLEGQGWRSRCFLKRLWIFILYIILCYGSMQEAEDFKLLLISFQQQITVTAQSLVCFLKETEGKKILPLWKAQCFGQLFILAEILCWSEFPERQPNCPPQTTTMNNTPCLCKKTAYSSPSNPSTLQHVVHWSLFDFYKLLLPFSKTNPREQGVFCQEKASAPWVQVCFAHSGSSREQHLG